MTKLTPGRVRITLTPHWQSRQPTSTIEGQVLLVCTTVIETGAQGGEFFAVPCLVVDTGKTIEQVPLEQNGVGVRVEKVPGAAA
jgi:hypothetical protein